MKLTCLYLDDAVVIPRSKNMGSGMPLHDTRDSSFHVNDGWDIRETLPGTFTITNEHMDGIVTIGGYGYSYVVEPPKVYEVSRDELDPDYAAMMEARGQSAAANEQMARQSALVQGQIRRRKK